MASSKLLHDVPPVELCHRCGHDAGEHVVLATNHGDPRLGGIILCPTAGCECIATWSAPQLSDVEPVVPDPADLATLRAMIQS